MKNQERSKKLFGLISAIIVGISYIGTILVKFGAQFSVSKSVYCLPRKYWFVFRLFVFIMSAGLGYGIGTTYSYIAGGLLSLVGIFVDVNDWRKKIPHLIGAIGGIVMFFYSIYDANIHFGIVTVSMFLIGSALNCLYVYINQPTLKYIWIIEIHAFGQIILGALYVLYL